MSGGALERLRAAGPAPDIAIVAGLGEKVAEWSFEELGLGAPRVAGHAGRWLLLGRPAGRFYCLLGRRHCYEGVSAGEVTGAVELLARAGVRRLILTNAAGGLVERLAPGALMRVADHISFLAPRLRGLPRGGSGSPWDGALGKQIQSAAGRAGVALEEGVLAVLPGPNYETRAEVVMLRRLGADAVSMSTVPEAIAAVRAGLTVAAISAITNSHVRPGPPPTHEEVLAVGATAAERLAALLGAAIEDLLAD